MLKFSSNNKNNITVPLNYGNYLRYFTCIFGCFMIYSILVIYMTRVYIVRHCETEGNALGLLQGFINLDISELGALQLNAVTERFEDIHLDAVYCSPLIRTQKTGKAVIGKKDLKLQIYDGLIELNCGIYEGKSYDTLYSDYPEFKDIWNNHPENFAPENGEKMVDAYERIWNTVLTLAKENKGKTIALATHGGVIRCLMCRLLKGDIKSLSTIPISTNTAISLIEFNDELNPKLVFFNDDSHLTEDLKNAKAVIPVGDK